MFNRDSANGGLRFLAISAIGISLNNAFKYVNKYNAKLLGTQGNKFYLDSNGEPVIDTGSFVQMIATAANVKPIMIEIPITI